MNAVVQADLPARFAENGYQCALVVSCCHIERGYVLTEALKNGWLKPADEVSPAIGAHIVE